ncbi:MAG: hypothetical protein R6U88_03355 [Candidatus Bipolaricaulota bacterium]
MRKSVASILMMLLAVTVVGLGGPVWVGVDGLSIVVDPAYDLWPVVEGSARYQGPVFVEDEPNWNERHTYSGVPIPAILQELGGMHEDDSLHVIAGDGYAKEFPRDVALGNSVLGMPILAWSIDGNADPDWPPLPVLIFLPEDGDVSNERMEDALGPLSHMFEDKPSASGLRVRGVSWLTTDWDYQVDSLPEHPELMPAPDYELSVVAKEETILSLRKLVATFPSVSGMGTYETATGREQTARYEGFPLQSLLGEWPEGTQVDVVAEDGYRVTYSLGELTDDEGEWILAFREDGAYIDHDPGPLRLVKVGPEGPRFDAARSPRMVVRVEVREDGGNS